MSFFENKESKNEVTKLLVTIIRGKAQKMQDNLVIAYAGTDYENARYWASMFLNNPQNGVPEMFSELNLKKDLMKKHPDCSLLLQEYSPATSFISIEKSFIVPRFINTALDISPPLNEILKKSKSGFGRIARWVRAQNLSYECVNTPEAQQEFYYQMYLPFITKRHEDSALIVSFENIFSSKIRSDLIMVTKNGERLAGAVLHYWKNRPTLGFFGVKMDKIDEVQRWNTGAMYYFAMLWAKNAGITTLHLGGSSAFLLNGINILKNKLGGRIDVDVPWQNSGMVVLSLLKKTDEMKRFLASNPFAFVGIEGDLKAAVWLPSSKNPDLAETIRQIDSATKLGIQDVDVFGWYSAQQISALQNEFKMAKISFSFVGDFYSHWKLFFLNHDI
jgi:hypothetical protein